MAGVKVYRPGGLQVNFGVGLATGYIGLVKDDIEKRSDAGLVKDKVYVRPRCRCGDGPPVPVFIQLSQKVWQAIEWFNVMLVQVAKEGLFFFAQLGDPFFPDVAKHGGDPFVVGSAVYLFYELLFGQGITVLRTKLL